MRTYAREDTVTRCDDRGTWLITLRGDHDISTVSLLEQQTDHVWRHCENAVIDLSEVTFIDSSLIAWLLRVEHALEDAHGFTLSIVTGPVGGVTGKLFKRIHMECVLACYPTRREAFLQAAPGGDALAGRAHCPHAAGGSAAGPRAA